MGRKGKSKTTRAREQRQRMKEKRQTTATVDAFMGLAPQVEEKPLARTMASPSSASQKNCPNALSLASSQGSLSISHVDMAPTSDSPLWVCTPPRVPSPRLEHQGVAGQAKLVEVTSIIKSRPKKMYTNNLTNNFTNNHMNTETILETEVEAITKTDIEAKPKPEITQNTGICKNTKDKQTKKDSADMNVVNLNDTETFHFGCTFNAKQQKDFESLNFMDINETKDRSGLFEYKNSELFQFEHISKTKDGKMSTECKEYIHSFAERKVCNILPYFVSGQNVVKGSFHQGNLRFGNNAGKQCVANCLLALVQSKLIPVSCWNCMMLDTILTQGNDLYSWIHGENDLLLVSDLPSDMEVNNMLVNVQLKESFAAMINMNENLDLPGALPLDQAIQESLIETDGCFICVQGFTCLVIKEENLLFLFDSHARNEQGLPAYNGSSVVLQLQSIDHLYHHLLKFVSQNVCVQFEITGVALTIPNLNAIEFASFTEDNCFNRLPKSRINSGLAECEIQGSTIEEKYSEGKSQSQTSANSSNINDIDTESIPDLEFVSSVRATKFDFKPTDIALRKNLCRKLNIPIKHLSKAGNYKQVKNMGCPKSTKSIIGDGNCLFRALSYAISQRQEFYSNIREAIVQHSMQNADKFSSFIDLTSIEQHIASNRMSENRSWGTAVEIIAAADLMKTDVFTYTDGKWIRYSAQQIDKDSCIHEKAIYLKHFNNHYEVVTSVTNNCQENNVVENEKINITEIDDSFSDDNLIDFEHESSNHATKLEINSVKKSKNENKRIKYHSTPEIREKKLKYAKERYSTNPSFRETVKRKLCDLYANDPQYKIDKIESGKKKYAMNEMYRQTVKDASITKYSTDAVHKQNVKDASATKYATDEVHRQNVKDASTTKYATDEVHRQNVKDASTSKYATDEVHQHNVKVASSKKYKVDELHRNKIKCQTRQRRERSRTELQQIETVIKKFRLESQKGPEYVCGCCFRLFFRKQLLECDFSIYKKSGHDDLSKQCISNKYVYRCDSDCDGSCKYANSSRNALWVCFTCHRKLLSGKMPAESHANNLDLENVPSELALNNLEQHLVALHIPFMKILGLPKGGQKGVHGPVVCVPSNLHKLTSALPRSEDENRLLAVKLKRKIEYKGYEEYQYISTKKLDVALNYLKQNNTWYSDVRLSENWLNPIPEEQLMGQSVSTIENIHSDKLDIEPESEQEDIDVKNDTTSADMIKDELLPNRVEQCNENESYLDDKLRGVQLDSCLQPADIGQEILDQCFDEVFNISPAEGNKPISVLQENGIEAKSFPAHFPSGKNTFNEEREEKLSLLRYFNMRLMSVDNRFAKDASYIFFAQYLAELDKVLSSVQIALRKEFSVTADGKKITSNMLMNKDSLRSLLKKDEAIKYLKPVRGTPPYWQAAQKDMFAMIRQLGKPTFFCSFSSADFRWTEMLETVKKQQGDTRNVENLDWKEKCKILYSNPVTLARMFDHRFHTFLKEVIMSDANPIGKVIDYFYRVEFQQRGSPHCHCLFWIEGAPIFGMDSNRDVVNFINKYVTCELPDEENDPELYEMVTSLHQHSKNHSKSCKKKGTVCRFNFPRPPSTQTFIAETRTCDESEANVPKAKKRLSELWDCILDETNQTMSVGEVFEKVGMTQAEFEDICSSVGKRNTVVLKRNVNEIYINHYNEHLLRAWNANMDIQYVLDEYSCVVYIISYISKAERELGLLLQQTKVEAAEGNLNAQQTMKKVGTAYLHHREISAQEAVYRVTGMNLKECSRKVEFIPLGPNPCRMSIPLKELERAKNTSNDSNDDEHSDDESMWMTSIVDRYKERPRLKAFEEMCLAQFCSDYSVLAKSQVPKKINEQTTFKLGNNIGYIRKRTRTKPAVIRYPRFSVETAPEKYYQSMLQLFLPYRIDQQLKPPQFETYEKFYNEGFVKLSSSETPTDVKSVVENNKATYVKVDQALENAERDLEERGYREDAWAELCPENEVDRLECILEGTSTTVVEEDLTDESIPDLNQHESAPSTNLLTSTIFPKNEVIPLLRSMNDKQREIFYKIREWCLKKANGEDVLPFYVFITGGGGTGKSHLIKCLYYEMTRILSKIVDHPDDATVLLTAPTGTAAFNISGMTIHSALGIYKSLSMDHALLSEDKINSLRSKYDSLQVIIIDEISMVNKRMLFFIHERLRQIKKMPENKFFGGVSVIAVGDFYQLPPVKTKKCDKLYVDDPSNPMNQLWIELFEIAELDEIMRQKSNSNLAEMLNRLRVRTKDTDIAEIDLSMLKTCMKQGPVHALHIFATNAEIQTHNNEMVMKLDSEVRLVTAEDYQKVKSSGQLIKMKSNFPDKDLQLPSSLLLAEGARVMLTKNVDIQDGLVNGVIGTIREIVQSGPNTLPQIIFIQFDNVHVGKNFKLLKNIGGKRCVGIEPCTEDVPKRNGSRKQFPLQLAWACTVHKVQGLTVQECVVDLNKCFSCGQAYVALSRVTSLDGLYIKHIEEKKLRSKIFCDSDVASGLSKMKPFLEEKEHSSKTDNITFLYHNIEGLVNHIEDLNRNPVIKNVDFICLTETWLKKDMDCSLEGFTFNHISRFDAYNTSSQLYTSLKQMQHGGVGVFFKNDSVFENVHLSFTNLECFMFKVIPLELVVVTIYRSQKYNLHCFMQNFCQLVQSLLLVTNRILILGDFNENILNGEDIVQTYMKSNGFTQCVTKPTTEGGTLIDHVYIRGIGDFNISVLPTYYSYHESIIIKIRL